MLPASSKAPASFFRTLAQGNSYVLIDRFLKIFFCGFVCRSHIINRPLLSMFLPVQTLSKGRDWSFSDDPVVKNYIHVSRSGVFCFMKRKKKQQHCCFSSANGFFLFSFIWYVYFYFLHNYLPWKLYLFINAQLGRGTISSADREIDIPANVSLSTQQLPLKSAMLI